MLHKAGHAFAPFQAKLGQLPHSLRNALNLNIGSNAQNNINSIGGSSSSGNATAGPGPSSASASAAGNGHSPSGSSGTFFDSNATASSLGNAGNSASGTGGAKWHAGRSYGYHAYSRGTTTSSADPSLAEPTAARTLDDEEDVPSAGPSRSTLRNASLPLLRRTRSSSIVEIPKYGTLPQKQQQVPLALSRQQEKAPASVDMSPSRSTEAHALASSDPFTPTLARSSPYSFTQSELQARYRHAFTNSLPLHVSTSISQTALPRAHAARFYSQQPPRLLITAAPSPQINQVPTEDKAPPVSSSVLPAQRASLPLHRSNSFHTFTRPKVVRVRRHSTSTTEAPHSIVAEPNASAAKSVTAEEALDKWSQDIKEIRDFARQDYLANRQEAYERLRTLYQNYKSDASAHTYDRQVLFFHATSDLSSRGVHAKDFVEVYDDFGRFGLGLHSNTLTFHAVRFLARCCGENMSRVSSLELLRNASRIASSNVDAQPVTDDAAAPASIEMNPTNDKSIDDNLEAMLGISNDQAEQTFNKAMEILATIPISFVPNPGFRAALLSLLASASRRGNADAALTVFSRLDTAGWHNNADGLAQVSALLDVYAKIGDWTAFDAVCDAGMKRLELPVAKPNLEAVSAEEEAASDDAQANEAENEGEAMADADLSTVSPRIVAFQQRNRKIDIRDHIMYGRLLQGQAVEAIKMLESMMESTSEDAKPTAVTLLMLIQGFAESGDIDAAVRWAARIHAQPVPDDLPSLPMLSDTFNTILKACASRFQADFNKTFITLQKAITEYGLARAFGRQVAILKGLRSRLVNGPVRLQEILAPPAPPSEVNSGISATSATPSLSSEALSAAFDDVAERTRRLQVKPTIPLDESNVPAMDHTGLMVDWKFSAKMDSLLRANTPAKGIYDIVQQEFRKNSVLCNPETLGRLIDRLARQDGGSSVVQDIYHMASKNLYALNTETLRTAAWTYLEDRMIIAMANAGNLTGVAYHRDRLLKAGAAPSADAYAAMINAAHDTTDDATVAVELFEESRRFGVVPSQFLYNVVISKLSKARRAQAALSLFDEMKAAKISPTAVTYGAIIAACCRTGDEAMATNYFNEMAESRGYKARVAPFNTMIQFYVSTKPDREKALAYFDRLLSAQVSPTSHTYKVLLDAYGSIQPVDLASVDDVFNQMLSSGIKVAGSHWAAVINAYGNSAGQLDKAIEIFESIEGHSSTADSDTNMPDVICYEALLNVFLTHSRSDLVAQYTQRMKAHFVRPTAYVNNTLIRSHAAIGEIEAARDIFNGMSDPVSGVAASGNHAMDLPNTEADQPVYREPSTYETMIRCEVTIGEKGKAEALLQQAVDRAFPTAIISRLRKIIEGESAYETSFPSHYDNVTVHPTEATTSNAVNTL